MKLPVQAPPVHRIALDRGPRASQHAAPPSPRGEVVRPSFDSECFSDCRANWGISEGSANGCVADRGRGPGEPGSGRL